MTPSVVSKATAPLPILSLACEAARRLGAAGVLILAEGPIDWDAPRLPACSEVAILVASASQRQLEAVRKAGLVAVEVEPSEAAIAERISLALIEAVANDQLQAGARVVVVYSGFEAEALDSMSVIRHHNWVWSNLITHHSIRVASTVELIEEDRRIDGHDHD